jgi:hypothetical protein
MGILNFDARSVAPQIGLDPVPDNWYRVAIMKSNIVSTSKGDGGMLKLEMSILDGQFQGRSLFWNLNLFNPSAQAVEIAYKQLSAIQHVIGVMNVNDQQAPDNAVPMLHNIPFYVHAIVVKGDKGQMNNMVGVKDINGNEPGKQQQQPVAPQGPAPGGWAAPGPTGPAVAPAAPGGWQAPAPAGQPVQGGTAPGGWSPPGQPAPAAPPPAQGPGSWGPPQGQPAQATQPTPIAPGGWTPPAAGGAPPPNAPWGRPG